jgi:hypothetical protein
MLETLIGFEVESTQANDESNSKARLAISDLFLDTDLQADDLEHITQTLRETRIQLDELNRIYEEDVAPALYMNLRVLPGGVWGGFNIDDLKSWIDKNKQRIRDRKSHSFFWKIYLWWITRETKKDWIRVQELFLSQKVGNQNA